VQDLHREGVQRLISEKSEREIDRARSREKHLLPPLAYSSRSTIVVGFPPRYIHPDRQDVGVLPHQEGPKPG
jgi:hypothetical protein